MSKVYIVLTQTGSVLSSIIKYSSGKEYNHVSIALDEDLDQLYSFGRTHPYNVLSGGFVHEGIKIGTFKRFKETKAKVLALDVTEQQYNALVENIKYMCENKKKYKFNRTGLVLAGFNKSSNSDYKFYCSEFVKHILQKSDVDISSLPKITHPEDFQKLDGLTFLYAGLFSDYDGELLH